MAYLVGSRQVGWDALPACHDGGEEPARWLARAGRCGGAAPAQGRAEGPTAQNAMMRGKRTPLLASFRVANQSRLSS